MMKIQIDLTELFISFPFVSFVVNNLLPAVGRLLLICTVLASGTAQAEMYKWVDEQGRTHYGDRPPADRQTEEIEGSISSYTGSSVEPLPEGFFDHLKKARQPKRKSVVMYSAEWCGVCKRAKAYFQKNKIPFTEHDIDKSEKARKDYEKLNGRGVPIILVGKQRMNGFSASRFEKMYFNN